MSHPIPEHFSGDINDTEGKARGAAQEAFLLPWNNAGLLSSVLEEYGADVAAVLMEPLCINGGGVAAGPGYLDEVQRLCRKHGVVLIFDEVITGFRVGLGGAQGLLGVTPDLATLGKAMAGGALPVSAVVGRRDIMKLYETRRVVHGGTFNGYPLGMAAVQATLTALAEAGAEGYARMEAQMSRVHRAFLEAGARYGLPLKMNGVPAAGVYHYGLVIEETQRQMLAQSLVKLISEAMVEHGVLVSNLNRFYGCLEVSEDDIRLFEQRVDEVFKVVGSFVERNAMLRALLEPSVTAAN